MNNYEEKKKFHVSQIPEKLDDKFTDEQHLAIYASGENIIVSAGAGSGKTAVLTERIIQKLIKGTKLSELIVLTFTKDAATGMKEKIRKSLTKSLSAHKELQAELDNLDSVHIQTFDAFCLDIVKEYHYLLNVSKNITIGDKLYLGMIKEKIMQEIFDSRYTNLDFQNFIKTHSIKDDDKLIQGMLDLFDKVNEEPNPDKFLDTYLDDYYSSDFNKKYEKIYEIVVVAEFKRLMNSFKLDCYTEVDAVDFALAIKDELKPGTYCEDLNSIYDFLDQLKLPSKKKAEEKSEQYQYLAEYKKKVISKKLGDFRDTYLDKLPFTNLVKEHDNTRTDVEVIISILKEFNQKYNEYLYENEIYDFLDIARLTLKVLNEHVSIRQEIINKTKEILVDEYQDTSNIQETLINLISNNNLFMVGDIKQSIYRFRHAVPDIFREKYNNYSKGNGGFAIDLTKNFRSRTDVLNPINEIFNPIMNQTFGGVDYNPNHVLRYGQTNYDNYYVNDSYQMNILKYNSKVLKDHYIEPSRLEATLIAEDILKNVDKYQVCTPDADLNKGEQFLRPANYGDFVILVPKRNCYEIYKEVFGNYGIPFVTDSENDFLSSEEVYFLTNTIMLAYSMYDSSYAVMNYQASLLGFLRSFVIGKSDQAISRLLLLGHSFEADFKEEYDKINKIKSLIASESLSFVIEEIYRTFNVFESLNKLYNVRTRIDKLNFLLLKARELEKSNIDILGFLEYLDYIRSDDKDIEFTSASEVKNAVHILTIHKSKGLEYPFCYISELSGQIKSSDGEGEFVFNHDLGIGVSYFDNGMVNPMIKKIISLKGKSEEISERIRLFYVALTRAKEKVTIITPDVPENYVFQDLNDGIRGSFNSISDMLYSIFDLLDNYIKSVDVMEYLDKLETGFKPLDKFTDEKIITNNNSDVRFVDLSKLGVEDESSDKIASHKVTGLIDEKVTTALNIGLDYHEILELVQIKNYREDLKSLNLDSEKYKTILNFYESSLIKNLKIVNEYHERPIYFNNMNGIIDLLIENDDSFIVIDYKTSDIDEDYYLDQVKSYMEYVNNIASGKQVKGYLYSILKGEFKEVC